MAKFHYWGPGFGSDQNDDGPEDVSKVRGLVAGELTGADIGSEANIQQLDQLYLTAIQTNDLCELGRLFQRHALAAMEAAVDVRMSERKAA